MNPKMILYIYILGICMTVASTYMMISFLIFDVPVQPYFPVIVAVCWVILIKFNPVFKEIIDKIKRRM
jgi:hypothetical protein